MPHWTAIWIKSIYPYHVNLKREAVSRYGATTHRGSTAKQARVASLAEMYVQGP
jgi:hypothetical protein